MAQTQSRTKRIAAPKKKAGASATRTRPTSKAILDAAEKLFAQQSYAETSLRQLMSAAGVSTTAFYARFPTKDAVLEGLANRFLLKLTQSAMERLSESRTLEEGFSVGAEVLMKAVRGKKPLIRLLLGESAASTGLGKVLGTAYGQIATLLGGNLQRLIDKGELEETDAETVGWAMVGAIKIQLERWAVFKEINDRQLQAALKSTAASLLPVVKRRQK
jgi:AcrR family transcriptional regulator